MASTDPSTPPNPPRLVLLAERPGPTSRAFARFPGTPVGVIRWHAPARPRPAGRRLRRVLSAPWRAVARVLLVLSGVRPRRADFARECRERGLRYTDIATDRGETLHATLLDWDAELVVTVCCPMVPMASLRDLRIGAINLHPSPLPAYRGSNPLFWQVVNREPELCATVHHLAAGVDRGAILAQARMPRPNAMPARALWEAVEERIGVPLLVDTIERLAERPDPGAPQPERSPTPYARSLRRSSVADVVPLSSLDPATADDLIRYLGECPPGWLSPTGWRRGLSWRAHRSNLDPRGEPPTGADGIEHRWRVETSGLRYALRHAEGTLWLRPFPRAWPLASPVRRSAAGDG